MAQRDEEQQPAWCLMAGLRLVGAWLNKSGGWKSTAANRLAHDEQPTTAGLDDRSGKNRGGSTIGGGRTRHRRQYEGEGEKFERDV